jgi:hypothetical protein
MSRSPHGYDPRDIVAQGKYTGEFDPIQQTDRDVPNLAMAQTRTDPLGSWGRKDQRCCVKTNPVLLLVDSVLCGIELDLHRQELYAISVYTQIA